MNAFYHGDCLFVMKHDIEPESVDLIYLDPPFFTGKIQKGTKKWQPGAMEISFEDSKRFWSGKAEEMREKAPGWLRYIALKRPDFASYLWYMMERLQACHKVLKKTGSIYLHCDYRASHYLKMVMDEIFEPHRFINEIVWRYKTGGTAARYFARKHHVILLYAKTSNYIFKIPKEKSYTKSKSRKPGIINYGGGTAEFFEDESGVYTWVNMTDVWDISYIGSTSPERIGYPTQKPEALLNRIIKASSNEGNLVLDPFCGCGTTVIVASKLNRKFIGIDINTSERNKGELPTAFSVIKDRSHELFAETRYISRDLSEVLEMAPRRFENWVNEFYRANKPSPDRGVDGITQDGIPIQVKTFNIGYKVLSQFITDAKYHPKTAKPIKKVIVASQVGFDDGARSRKFEIETNEDIEVVLTTPEDMLKLE